MPEPAAMNITIGGLDVAVLLLSLVSIMGIGIWMGRKEEDAEDFFLAGRSVPWWGVAGSIFGTNISANHLVGMMGVGMVVGFAQAHYEVGAIAGLMVLCYVFLPLYLKMRVFTLSEYLGKRFGEESRVVFSAINVILMDCIRMVMGFYIGARVLALLFSGTPIGNAIEGSAPGVWLDGQGFSILYLIGVAMFVFVTGAYTIFGGLKAVIWTDVIQSTLLMLAGLVIAFLVIYHESVGGFMELFAKDAAMEREAQKFHLYLPPDSKIPWTGVFTGLVILNFNFWGCNQYIAQRTLAARSDWDARMGIIVAGFLKLIVPFFTIVAGIAAYHYFAAEDMTVAADDVFTVLVAKLIPAGYGLMGLICAGLVGAILSSVDSMMNSGATMVTFDFYKRFHKPNATQRELITFGRYVIVAFVVVGGLLAATVFSPDQTSAFFLVLSSATGHFVPGIVMAFCFGVFWKRATRFASFLALVASPFFSFAVVWFYNGFLGVNPNIAAVWGEELNFLHRTALTGLFGFIVMIVVSLLTQNQRDAEKEHYIWVNFRGPAEGEEVRTFWRSEKPWAILLCASAIAIMIIFA